MNEQDFVMDDEIEEMFGGGDEQEAPGPQMGQPQAQAMQPMNSLNGLALYPMALAQAPVAPAGDGLLTRKFGPLPVWGWALTAIGTGIGGYFLWQQQSQKKVSSNDGDDGDDDSHALPAETGSTRGGSWTPSRGGFADQLGTFFTRKRMADKVKIYNDATEAKKSGLRHLSPLINLKFSSAYKPDKDLVRICKREGLNPILHEDGTVGLYPMDTGKRGQEWIEYINLLRDDGQKI